MVNNMKKVIISILFNLFETLCIFFVGYLLKISLVNELIMLMLFAIPRFIFKGASHYKSPFKCFVISMLLGSSFMFMFNTNQYLGYIFALFSGCLLTQKGNISNIYQWNKVSKYQSIIDYINENPNDYIIDKYEEYLLIYYPFRYEIYNLKFKQNLPLDKIMNDLSITSYNKLVSELDIINDTLNFCLFYYE